LCSLKTGIGDQVLGIWEVAQELAYPNTEYSVPNRCIAK